MKINLLNFKKMSSFPSASGIEYYDDKIYLVGDDAADILVTNKRWKKQGSIKLFESEEKRIPKKIKADLEATAIVKFDDAVFLLVMGSGSKELRNKGILVDVVADSKIEFDCSVFYERLRNSGLGDLNIEGAAQVNEHLIFCNRGNKANPDNHLIVTSPDFYRRQHDAPLELFKIDLSEYEGSIGISGLTYSEKNECLLFTTSMEDTDNSYDDGRIGKSYLGIIHNAYRKIGRGKMKVNELIDLAASKKIFDGYKIESVCIQSDKNDSMKLHLVADNDDGESYLFKVLLRL